MIRIPDRVSILRFRHLLEANDLAGKILETVNAHVAAHGYTLREGTAVDATLIAAPSSSKNSMGGRDPEMKQTKKGNNYYFGLKAHIGVDAETGLVHTVIATPANMHDVTQAHALLHGHETEVFADAGYQGVGKREENRDTQVTWHVAMRLGKRRKLDKATASGKLLEQIEHLKASIRAKVEHPFRMIKLQFGHTLDTDATAANIKAALGKAVAGLKAGDRFVFWYSGHGAQLVDGDVATDVICPVDFKFTNDFSVTVTDFHGIFSGVPNGCAAFWGSDSCHSGDLEKDMRANGVPKLFRGDMSKAETVPLPKPFKHFRDISAALPNIVLMSGCRSDQTSADAYINGGYNGTFTYYFIQALAAPNGLNTPLQTLNLQIQQALTAGGYTQSPQLSGRPDTVQRPFLRMWPVNRSRDFE